jgi:DNA-binding MarR family transcriptional regulator
MAKPKRSRRPTVPGERLLDALAQTSFATMAILHRVAAENDLSLTQLRVAGILRDRRLRMAELAGYLGLEKSTMTGLVERAEARGIMARASGQDDGRVIDVFLTSEGLKLAARVERQVQEALAPLTDRLEAADQRRLQGLLERLLLEPAADGAQGIVRTRVVATPSRARSGAHRE